MSEINSNTKETSKAKMTEINKVEGFNPLDFIEKYPQIPRDGKGYADLDLETMENALSAVSKLVEAIDEDALKKNFVRPNTPVK